ncbi:DUF6298 domain-containing protein [Pedobacter sp. SYSU D00535]|uniref:DUF6298 domain-containing protein n=1 Tax=Pedobacter sp. SYSU D00535 TaxID=2810308 RepID=UPI001F62446F|nr:DUF6298 domain-containing protein [Pedobacter sp. SYSU D00535]
MKHLDIELKDLVKGLGLKTFIFLAVTSTVFAQKKQPEKPVAPITIGPKGSLSYNPDSLGNRIPDYSYAGYKAGESAIPNVAVKVTVPVKAGDATARIQSALDYVASLPVGKDGFRGAVLLEKGTYQVNGGLVIKASGVVLRGSGMQDAGTILLGAGDDRQTLISVKGINNLSGKQAIKITDSYVPVNAMKFRVASTAGLKAGDMIQVIRPSTKEWIDVLGANEFGGGISALGWKPGTRDLTWDRKIVSINGTEITIDAPVTTALDARFGAGTIVPYAWNGRIANVGVENIQLQSSYDKSNSKDEDHRWMAVVLENVQDAWVRQVVFKHFAGSAVNVLETARRVTVEDCKSLAPISEIAGQRRYTFLTSGQQTLFQRLYSEFGYHDFAVGFTAAGPNAFVQCESHLPFSFSGTIDSWASGVLFDIVNIDGNALSLLNRNQDAQGAGWTAANSMIWQCAAARIDNYAPPTAQNWAIGNWAQFAGNGFWDMSNEHVQPRSFYYAQLKQRLGQQAESREVLLPVGPEASTSPKVEVAMALTKEAAKPPALLIDFIDLASSRNPIPTEARGVKTIDRIGVKEIKPASLAPAMAVKNGWIVRGDQIVTGRKQEVPWWSGSARPYFATKAKSHVTRFVPGKTGRGLTDDLDSVSNNMLSNNIVALDHNYGLWYERRRDDHERVRRMDGEVWPPFYELPFARSGQGTAWDGLSKYDLTKYNKWYWNRLKQFADLADQKGLMLIHQNYFQHNIIEAGAHYSDFPWRPANNINNTPFPEPVNYAGDKRIFYAENFYNLDDPAYRDLHRAYIRKCLDNFAGNSGVIQSISAEYTGPLHFVQFWLDVIKEWEKEKGKNALVALSTTKDVQDAILADPARAAAVDIIDIKYWHYQANGTAYEPKGGLNLAPRQHARLLGPKKTSFDQVYRAVSEYRQKFPEKAVMYTADNYDSYGLAAFLAGGSMANVSFDKEFLAAVSGMKVYELPGKPANQFALYSPEKGYLVYNESDAPLKLNLTGFGESAKVQRLDPKTGKSRSKAETLKTGATVEVAKQSSGPELIWITKK